MNMTAIYCNKCGRVCEKPTKEINRQKRIGKIHFYCSLSCSSSDIRRSSKNINKKCLWCKKDFISTNNKKGRKCCSIICARKYSQSKVDFNIHKISVQKEKTYPRFKTFHCVICGKIFEKIVKNSSLIKKTCSEKCYSILRSELSRNNPKCGGEIGYKHFLYKNIIMDSSWEVEIAKWMDENKIKWERDRKKHMFWWTDRNGNKRRYYPDFYLPDYDVYLDPKNKYRMGLDAYKINSVFKENKIQLFWGILDDIKKSILNMGHGNA